MRSPASAAADGSASGDAPRGNDPHARPAATEVGAPAGFLDRLFDRLLTNAVRAIVLLLLIGLAVVALPVALVLLGVVVIVVLVNVIRLRIAHRRWARSAGSGLGTGGYASPGIGGDEMRENVRIRTPGGPEDSA